MGFKSGSDRGAVTRRSPSPADAPTQAKASVRPGRASPLTASAAWSITCRPWSVTKSGSAAAGPPCRCSPSRPAQRDAFHLLFAPIRSARS